MKKNRYDDMILIYTPNENVRDMVLDIKYLEKQYADGIVYIDSKKNVYNFFFLFGTTLT